jgi:hypothetical protein
MGTDLQARSVAVATSKCSVGPVAFRPAEPLPACDGASCAALPSRPSERREHASASAASPHCEWWAFQGGGDMIRGGASTPAARAAAGADRRSGSTVEMPCIADTGQARLKPRSGVEKAAAKRLRRRLVHRMKGGQQGVESLSSFLEEALTRTQPRESPCLTCQILTRSNVIG